MCNNGKVAVNIDNCRELYFFKLGSWSARLLRGESKSQIAESEGISVEKLEKYLKEIQNINPTLYAQIIKAL